MKERGKFIVLEGIAGSGKDTQEPLLAEFFRNLGNKVLVTREHTRDRPIGALIERAIRGTEEKIDPLALQILYTADRADHTASVIRPALAEYDLVLGNRYDASTVAYSPVRERRMFLDLNTKVIEVPDLICIIDLDPKEAVRRVITRNDGRDIFDKVEILKQCREGYRWYFDNSGRVCAWIDGSGTREEVFNKILGEIKSRKIVNGYN